MDEKTSLILLLLACAVNAACDRVDGSRLGAATRHATTGSGSCAMTTAPRTVPQTMRVRSTAVWLAGGVCVAVALLSWFGDGAIREWRRSSPLSTRPLTCLDATGR